ncbi:leader peptidase (prepilin peptidase)/N-methyltransferase [Bradyrhizobium sp. i1.8.4]|uniref:prepilin peptidase n=1 Tax=unclassified Bradyrhizobium TaxID=2631580 RepID=UPI003D1A3A9A
MTIDRDADDDSNPNRFAPNGVVLACGFAAVALVSATTLPWPHAVASTVLGTLMVAGADVDARSFVLPDAVTGGALLAGLVAAVALDPIGGWTALTGALGGSILVAAAIWLMRRAYHWLRQREGLGFGDVKLAAAVGAWLPLDTVPLCFTLASCVALIAALLTWPCDRSIQRTAKLPFGAFLCPALWLVDYAVRLLAA